MQVIVWNARGAAELIPRTVVHLDRSSCPSAGKSHMAKPSRLDPSLAALETKVWYISYRGLGMRLVSITEYAFLRIQQESGRGQMSTLYIYICDVCTM